MKVSLALLALVSPFCLAAEPVKALTKSDVISLSDGVFQLDGARFAEISFNKFDLMWSMYGERLAGHALDEENPVVKAQDKALANLRKLGFRSIRIFAFPWGDGAAEIYQDPAKHRMIFEALDKTAALCERHGIGIVWSLCAGSFTNAQVPLKRLCADPESRNRKVLETYLDEVIQRYKNSPAVLMWEIHNELTLAADIPEPAGSKGETVPTLKEVAAFYQDIASFVRKRDPLRLVNNGGSMPREFQWNLYQRNGWKRDTYEEQRKCFELLFRDSPIDVIDIHYYLGHKQGVAISADDGKERLIGLKDYLSMAAACGKPLMIGEVGRAPAPADDKTVWTEASDYFQSVRDTDAALPWIHKLLDEIVESRVQLAYWWTYQSDREMDVNDRMSLDVSIERNPEIVKAVAEANQRLKEKLGIRPVSAVGK